jgi:very-short-patch-repair endonuclease
VWRDAVRVEEIVEALAACPRIPDRRALTRLVDLLNSGATSPLEILAKTRVFTGAPFANLEWQAELRILGRDRRADILHRSTRTVIELDGRDFHGDNGQRLRDLERDVEFAAEGYVTLRFTYSDLTTRPRWCRLALLKTIGLRGVSARLP